MGNQASTPKQEEVEQAPSPEEEPSSSRNTGLFGLFQGSNEAPATGDRADTSPLTGKSLHSGQKTAFGYGSTKAEGDDEAPYESRFTWDGVNSWQARRFAPMEGIATFVLSLAGFVSRDHPWAVALLWAGLIQAMSTDGYLLQANPILTIGSALRNRRPLGFVFASLSSQLLGTMLAVSIFSIGPNHGIGPTFPNADCQLLSWGGGAYLVAVMSSIFSFVSFSTADSVLFGPNASRSSYAVAVGSAYAASVSSVHSRAISSGLFNPYLGLLALLNAAVQRHDGHQAAACGGLYFIAPLIGLVIGMGAAWLTALDKSETANEVARSRLFQRCFAFSNRLSLTNWACSTTFYIEMLGVTVLVIVLAATQQALPVGSILVGLTIAFWRRSGAHFNPALAAATFFLRHGPFVYTSLLFYVIGQFIGALLGVGISLLFPGVPSAVPWIKPEHAFASEHVGLQVRGSTLLVIFAVACYTVFLHQASTTEPLVVLPALMTSLTFLGSFLVFGGNVFGTGLFNPAITLIVWPFSNTSFLTILLGTLLLLIAVGITVGLFSKPVVTCLGGPIAEERVQPHNEGLDEQI